MPKNLSINYYGYFTPIGGYGIANLNWVKHLKRLGVDVSVHAKFKPIPETPEWDMLNKEERNIFKVPFEKRRIGVIETNPFDFDTNISEIKIANTMCECDHVSKSWSEKLNNMDYILVPNEFNKRVFVESGVTKPIKVLPHGTETEKFPYKERHHTGTFNFGLLGFLDPTDRKGAFDVIRAFSSEFDNNEDVGLWLHSSDDSFNFYSQYTDKRIFNFPGKFTFDAVRVFYESIDCFVFPSKAEGVGQPPREAMASGLPVIVTNWSGLEDIALPEICYPINPTRLEKRPNFIEQDGNWAIIDIQELMYWMRYVYENQKQARLKGKKAASYIRSNQSWEKCAQNLVEFLNEI